MARESRSTGEREPGQGLFCGLRSITASKRLLKPSDRAHQPLHSLSRQPASTSHRLTASIKVRYCSCTGLAPLLPRTGAPLEALQIVAWVRCLHSNSYRSTPLVCVAVSPGSMHNLHLCAHPGSPHGSLDRTCTRLSASCRTERNVIAHHWRTVPPPPQALAATQLGAGRGVHTAARADVLCIGD